ncbi:carboxylating nicotinate-nucleotide diphosphorylase [Sanyastnella coralliicola]|uniref:carboxylating nicotinate-nucleotide diphosphorylase n=1 Tax=Sanyastnella coralliicola TaxID=3069118 RepID=UPI0027B9D951|nr:carboxylating nicotinate-nucleotide diphosphorylase [Longitalea sp. SCSIO 12813]
MEDYDIIAFIRAALEEDVRDGDHSSLSCIPADAERQARLIVKDNGVLAGVAIAELVFREVDASLTMETFIQDGERVKFGDIAFHVKGSARSILTAERLVLNLMQRMSGIATRTRSVVDLIDGTGAKVLDTRKTTPLLRYFEKRAVKIGGGENHRFGLYDMIMLKDNHVDYAGGIEAAVRRTMDYLKEKGLNIPVEVETRNMDEVREALNAPGVDRIMLDNFTPDQVREAVKFINGRVETEASGGITLDTIRGYAETGVDYISMGALTHSVKSLDMSLKAF